MWQIDFYLAMQREREREVQRQLERQIRLAEAGGSGTSRPSGRLPRGIRAVARVAGGVAGAIASAIEWPAIGSNHV